MRCRTTATCLILDDRDAATAESGSAQGGSEPVHDVSIAKNGLAPSTFALQALIIAIASSRRDLPPTHSRPTMTCLILVGPDAGTGELCSA